MRKKATALATAIGVVGLVACGAFSADDPPAAVVPDGGSAADSSRADGASSSSSSSSSSSGSDADVGVCPLRTCPDAGTCALSTFLGPGPGCYADSGWSLALSDPTSTAVCSGNQVELSTKVGGTISLVRDVDITGKTSLTIGARLTVNTSSTTRVIVVRPKGSGGGVDLRIDDNRDVSVCPDGGTCVAAGTAPNGRPFDVLLRLRPKAGTAELRVDCGGAVQVALGLASATTAVVSIGRYETGPAETITFDDVVVLTE